MITVQVFLIEDAMRSAPLYLKLKEQIKGDLLAGHARGEPSTLATLNELQVRYDASRPTISKALTALAAEGLLVKQAGRGMFALSPSLSDGNGLPRIIIGYIAPLTNAELPQNVYHGIDRIAQRRNCRVLIASAGNDVEQERMAANEMIAAGVRGLIIYPDRAGRIIARNGLSRPGEVHAPDYPHRHLHSRAGPRSGAFRQPARGLSDDAHAYGSRS